MSEIEGILEHGHSELGTVMQPVPVHIVGKDNTERVAPEFSAWSSWTVTGTIGTDILSVSAFRVLPRNDYRERAVLLTTIPSGLNAYWLIGSREQVQNGQGFKLYCNGKTLEYQGAQEVWAIATTIGADPIGAVLSVLDERYSVNQ